MAQLRFGGGGSVGSKWTDDELVEKKLRTVEAGRRIVGEVSKIPDKAKKRLITQVKFGRRTPAALGAAAEDIGIMANRQLRGARGALSEIVDRAPDYGPRQAKAAAKLVASRPYAAARAVRGVDRASDYGPRQAKAAAKLVASRPYAAARAVRGKEFGKALIVKRSKADYERRSDRQLAGAAGAAGLAGVANAAQKEYGQRFDERARRMYTDEAKQAAHTKAAQADRMRYRLARRARTGGAVGAGALLGLGLYSNKQAKNASEK